MNVTNHEENSELKSNISTLVFQIYGQRDKQNRKLTDLSFNIEDSHKGTKACHSLPVCSTLLQHWNFITELFLFLQAH